MKQVAFPGDELRARREELGFTTYDVYRRVRIPDTYIAALERGEIDALPAPCYTVGFIKTYCRFLGLPPEPYLDRVRPETRSAVRFLRIDSGNEGLWAGWLRELAAWGVVCAFLVLAWVAYSVVFHPNAEEGEGRVQAGAIELVIPPTPENPQFTGQ